MHNSLASKEMCKKIQTRVHTYAYSQKTNMHLHSHIHAGMQAYTHVTFQQGHNALKHALCLRFECTSDMRCRMLRHNTHMYSYGQISLHHHTL